MLNLVFIFFLSRHYVIMYIYENQSVGCLVCSLMMENKSTFNSAENDTHKYLISKAFYIRFSFNTLNT